MRISSLYLTTLVWPSLLLANSEYKSEKEKMSYIIGHQIGSSLKRDGLEIDQGILLKGLKAGVGGEKSVFSPEETRTIMTNAQKELQAKMEAKRKADADKNTAASKTFLEANAKKSGVKTLASGLQYKVIKEGKGENPKNEDSVTTHYRGTLIDGTEFDSSIKRGEPAKFPVNGVIKGWTEALTLMKPGAKWELYVPSELGYGERGSGELIGPNAALIFEVELISIQKATPPAAPAKDKDAEKKKK